MAFASRDLCCSVPKVSSDQLCLLASADSEGERGRTGVASVSERARASEGVCYFIIGEGCGSKKVGLPDGYIGSDRECCQWGGAPCTLPPLSTYVPLGVMPYSTPHLLTTPTGSIS